MEDLLGNVIVSAASMNLVDVKQSAQEAYDFLSVQQGLIRDPPFELREKCFAVLKMCLESRKSKLVTLAVSGFHKILRDDRFHSNFEPNDDTVWLPSQLLQAISSILTQTDDTQVDLLKVVLNMACSAYWSTNGRIIISVITMCSEAYESGNSAVCTAALAAASQTLRSFCNILELEMDEKDEEASSFTEIIPIMQFLCCKIDEFEGCGHCENGVVFLLECLLTVTSSLPQSVHKNKHLITFLWQKMCPVLISVLGTPRVDKNFVTRHGGVDHAHGRGRGSGGLATAPSFQSCHAKTVYSITIDLVRLIGCVGTLRPVLESVFHRMLLYPPPEHRLDALKAATDLIRNPSRLVDLAGPLILCEGDDSTPPSDMALIRLIMDAIEECSGQDSSVYCAVALLSSLEELCRGRCVTSLDADRIRRLFPSLRDCDYEGPLTYQSMSRLPKVYVERIQKEWEETDGRTRRGEGGLGGGDESDSSSGIGRPASECESDVTEGPEDELNIDELQIDENDCVTDRIPKTLKQEPYQIPIGLGDSERQHARHFIGALHDLLPALLPMRSSIQIDEALQTFASQYCQGVMSEQSSRESSVIVNADGIYLATYTALLLDMTLSETGYYTSHDVQLCMNEEEFIEEVHNTVVLVYLSRAWLQELYQAVVSSSLLQAHHFLPTNTNTQPHALVNLLTDVNGTKSTFSIQGSRMLTECRRLERTSQSAQDLCPEVEAGVRLSRRILTCCWDSLMIVLSSPLSKKFSIPKVLKEKSLKLVRSDKRRADEAKQIIALCLDGLQCTARLCNRLGLQDRCGNILGLLATASCTTSSDLKLRLARRVLKVSYGGLDSLTASHALSMDLLLGSGLELGSHCPDCWPHVFKCCVYICNLEHECFSQSQNRNIGGAAIIPVVAKDSNRAGSKEKQLEDEDTCVDVYSFLYTSGTPQTVSETVGNSSSWSVLSTSDAAKVLCSLSQQVDKLYDDAAIKLNLQSLEEFCRALCIASDQQLFPYSSRSNKSANQQQRWWYLMTDTERKFDVLLLDRIGEVMLKCVRSSRPLIHVMRVWAVVGPHLLKACCHRERKVNKKAVEKIHDTVNAVLNEHSEKSHFHLNEALMKPFETLLCLELCDTDVQDQIVGCICEYVEASSVEIRSGWRSLFATLRCVSSNTIVLDVFKVFLESDNPLVFCNAAVDCLLCLLKHLRGGYRLSSDDNMSFAALDYLKKCRSLLSSMYRMPTGFVFHSSHRIQAPDCTVVDPVIPDLDLVKFEHTPHDLATNTSTVTYGQLSVDLWNSRRSLDTIDRPSGVLRVWYMMLEGLYSAAVTAHPALQPHVLELLFTDLVQIIHNPGPEFGLFSVNHLIIPMAQSWLRQCNKPGQSVQGLKHSIGLLSDLVVQYFHQLHDKKRLDKDMTLLLVQQLLLLIECCHCSVTKIDTSYIRHIVLSCGKHFNVDQWRAVVVSLHRCCDVTLVPLRQIMMAFTPGSQSFYGDYGQVKIAARRDSSQHDVMHLKHLYQQVFLLEVQREVIKIKHDDDMSEQIERSYTFLLYPTVDYNQELVIRVTMKQLVSSLLVHNTMLQTLAGLLLHGTKYVITSLANVLLPNPTLSPADNVPKLPGLMSHMTTEDIIVLLDCLEMSYHASVQFDSRPGLKFLVQKVAGLERAANLYLQAGAAWAIRVVTLFELCLYYVRVNNVTSDDLRDMATCGDRCSGADWTVFVVKLKTDFVEICDNYVELVLDKNGAHSVIDRVPDQPIFFLMASQDEPVPEIKTEEERTEMVNEPENLDDDDEDDEDKDRPFVLSELGRDSSSDSEGTDNVDGKVDNGFDEDAMTAVIEEYKRRKRRHSDVRRKNPFLPGEPVNTQTSGVPTEIEEQRTTSILKDSQAHRQVWADMIESVFDVLTQLSDAEFKTVLPLLFDGIRRLTAHATDPLLKQTLAELIHRVGIVYGIGSM